MRNWVNLHSHSSFSMLDGHGKVDEYASRAHSLSMGALAITDHGNLHGWMDFYEACHKNDIKPILGCEFYQARKTRFNRDEEERAGKASQEWAQRGPYHLSVLAKDNIGYQNMMKISSQSYVDGFYVKPRVDKDLIAEHSEGLIVLSGCLGGEIQQALLRNDYKHALMAAAEMQSIVGRENYFIEIQNHGLPEQKQVLEGCLKIAKTIGAKVVATGDTHYVNQEDAVSHDIMLCIQTKSMLDQEDRFKFFGPEFYLKSYDEMLPDVEAEWLDNTVVIAEMVDINLDHIAKHKIPRVHSMTPETDSDKTLADMVWRGVESKYPTPLEAHVIERAEYELGVIRRMGFSDYFLVVEDIVTWCRSEGIATNTRGSAAGSLVSYALGITNLDPFRFDLMFERFLIEGRNEMPDIDLDIDDRYRDRVVEYVTSVYGKNRVAQIVTFTRIQARTAIRDATRIMGYPYALADKIAKLLPPTVQGRSLSIKESFKTKEFRDEYDSNEDSKRIIDAAIGLEGVPRQTSVHAAGVVIAPTDITDYIPVIQYPTKSGEPGPVVTAWEMDWMEKNGLLKIDFLGSRNLSILDICEKLVQKNDSDFDLDKATTEGDRYDDEETYRQIRVGNTVGMFQLESSGIQEMAKSLAPTCIEDIMALESLYRPGPMGSGADRMYINRKHGKEKVDFPHPLLREVLEASLGIMLYQEDVINVCKTLAGLTISQADKVRKAMGKKLVDQIAAQKIIFVEGCKQANNIDEATASKIYALIEFFGGYGFGKAHAASYGVVCYQTAYLKTHYPVEYMTAVMSTVYDKPEKQSLYLYECRKMNIPVAPPSILESEKDFSISDDRSILFGLNAIAGFGESLVDAAITQERNYENLFDFFRKCNIDLLKKNNVETIIRSGAADDMILGSQPLSLQEKHELLDIEKELLGIYVSDHPLAEFAEHISENVSHTVAELPELETNTIVKLGGIIADMKERITKRGDKMYNMVFEDLTGSISVLVFPYTAKRVKAESILAGKIGVLEGKLAKEGEDDVKIFFESFEETDAQVVYYDDPIVLDISDYSMITTEFVDKINNVVELKEGKAPVVFSVPHPSGTHMMKLQLKLYADPSIEDELKELVNGV